MDPALTKDLIKSVVDKLFIGLVVFAAGWFWANVIEADRTFWKSETERLKSDSDVLIKLLDREKSSGELLRTSAALAIASNGLNEAIIVFCNAGPWWRPDPYAEWCDESSRDRARQVPGESDFLARYAISPGRRALYESVVQGATVAVKNDGASQPVAAAVDSDFRNSPARRASINAMSGDAATSAQAMPQLQTKSYPVATSVQTLSRSLPTRVYVQVDEALARGDEKALRDLLDSAKKADREYLVPSFERIATSKMPKASQIRYFNEGDKATAESLQRWLAGRDVNAQVVRVPLAAPPNQIELWYVKR